MDSLGGSRGAGIQPFGSGTPLPSSGQTVSEAVKLGAEDPRSSGSGTRRTGTFRASLYPLGAAERFPGQLKAREGSMSPSPSAGFPNPRAAIAGLSSAFERLAPFPGCLGRIPWTRGAGR